MSVDLTTTYLGLKLKNPLVASASPLTGKLDSLRQLEEAGASAAVWPSLFEEQIEHEAMEVARLYDQGTGSFSEADGFLPELDEYRIGPEAYLKQMEEAKKQLSIPLIGSLNGASKGGWVRYAKMIQDAGADALELNIYFIPTDPKMGGPDVEKQYLELVAAVKESISIPLAVKMGPYFSGLPSFAARLIEAGAAGLVLFNRFLEPDVDLEALEFRPSLQLSTRSELRLPLRWIAILRDHVNASLAATSGVHFTEDVIKSLLVGADCVMMASVLLQRGPGYLKQMLQELQSWLEEKEYESVEQLKGSMSRIRCSDPSELERANYMKALISYTDKV
ncbi:MAG: dihydroorotate dehydrogenase-like protein [Candidatus Anammoximicrobium sp.]|nr:dihydroorotate dehydrogenase-like protein [Candidatus Anammoximicrobium sp.]